MHNLATALSIIAICTVAYYAGIYMRFYLWRELSPAAVTNIRFSTLPLILVAGIVMASQLNAARDGFLTKQRTIEDMASIAIQIDRALTYYGAPAEKAQKDYRDYIRHLIKTPDALWGGVDRGPVEQFAVDFQTLPVPAKDPGIASSTKHFILDLMGKMSLDRYKLATLSVHGTYVFTTALLSLWLATIFICVGLTSDPLCGVAFWSSLAVAICVGSMSFVTNEFDNSRAGLIQVSSAPFDRLMQEIGE